MKKVLSRVAEIVMFLLGYDKVQVCRCSDESIVRFAYTKIRHIEGLDWDDMECDLEVNEDEFVYFVDMGHGFIIHTRS